MLLREKHKRWWQFFRYVCLLQASLPLAKETEAAEQLSKSYDYNEEYWHIYENEDLTILFEKKLPYQKISWNESNQVIDWQP